MKNNRTPGSWIILIAGIFLLADLLLGQTMSFIDYNFTVVLGLQESKEIVGEMGVAVNKGFGVADTIIYTPLLLAGLIGFWKRERWGLWALGGALAITAYWPLVCLFFLFFAKGSPGFNFSSYLSYTIILVSITLYGLWGLWYLYKNYELLLDQRKSNP